MHLASRARRPMTRRRDSSGLGSRHCCWGAPVLGRDTSCHPNLSRWRGAACARPDALFPSAGRANCIVSWYSSPPPVDRARSLAIERQDPRRRRRKRSSRPTATARTTGHRAQRARRQPAQTPWSPKAESDAAPDWPAHAGARIAQVEALMALLSAVGRTKSPGSNAKPS